jgi:flagellar biosynthesis chaperone FliJ
MSVRRHRKNEAARQLLEASGLRAEAEDALAHAQRTTERMEQELVACLTPSGRASEVIIRQNALAFQRVSTERLRQDLSRAIERENSARDAVMRAQQEEKALIRLREKRVEAYRIEQDREDERLALEFVNARGGLSNG